MSVSEKMNELLAQLETKDEAILGALDSDFLKWQQQRDSESKNHDL